MHSPVEMLHVRVVCECGGLPLCYRPCPGFSPSAISFWAGQAFCCHCSCRHCVNLHNPSHTCTHACADTHDARSRRPDAPVCVRLPQERETLLSEWQQRLEAQQEDLMAAQSEVQLGQQRTAMEHELRGRWGCFLRCWRPLCLACV